MRKPKQRGAKSAPLFYRNQRMNSMLEVDYATRLDYLLRAGKIERWDYEPERFLLGVKCTYAPDFRVIMPDGNIVFIETKGYLSEQGRVKFRTAAHSNPMYGFIMVGKVRGSFVLRENLSIHPDNYFADAMLVGKEVKQ